MQERVFYSQLKVLACICHFLHCIMFHSCDVMEIRVFKWEFLAFLLSFLTRTEPQTSATTNYICFLLPLTTPRNATGVREARSLTLQPCLKLRLSSWQPCKGGTIFILQIWRASPWKIKQYAPIHLRTKRADQSSNSEISGSKACPPPTTAHSILSCPILSPTRAGSSLGLGFGMTLSEVWLAKTEQKQRTHFPLAYLCFHCRWYNSETRRK